MCPGFADGPELIIEASARRSEDSRDERSGQVSENKEKPPSPLGGRTGRRRRGMTVV